ncbi:hypothetical protein C8F04DRAFT_1064144 [Mycena alexandri]|uniref:Novel STAND NTPase 1 domain-containing protein n=1 Tax=Mycena alexandri TaxID=1745969 RepID=A0AAD6TM75_9AGAR|nr:hypothetical protein C8F04DRAFT_1064144 [Mycena alexandri]
MQPATKLADLIEYTSFAASTLGEIARSAQIPFLLTAASLSSMILDFVRASRTTKQHSIQMVEQIHEILFAIISLYSETVVARILPPSLLHDISKFTETLQKIYSFMQAQQGMGKIKQLLNHTDSTLQLDAYRAGLQDAMHALRIQTGISTVSGMAQAQKDVQQQHEDLMELLAAHPDIASSDSTSVRTLSTFATSVESFAMFPASPKIFHGREQELQQIMDLLSRESPRIVILGPGGMGKTSLAVAILHSDTASKYEHRHFVSCHSSPSYLELVSNIASHIGVDHGPNLAGEIVRHFSRSGASLLILDNLETPWEALDARADVEELLSLLADVPHLAILVTMRGAERPGKVQWTRPCPLPLAPLSEAAALQTFRDISDSPDESNTGVQDLLDLAGGLPLAVSLIANVAAYEGCDTALERWRTESTRLLSDGFDKTSSLEISVTLSLSSPRMDLEAQKLLSILSMLPDGLSEADLVQSNLPISGILRCKMTLIRTSLAYIDYGHRLKVLVPIREYVRSIYPSSSEVKIALRKYFGSILNLWDDSEHITAPKSIPQISANLGNFNRLFSDAMQMDYPDTLDNLRSALLFNSFCRHAGSPVRISLSQKIVQWQHDPVFGTYLIAELMSLQHGGAEEIEARIQSGHRFFEASGALEKAQWHNTLGHHYFVQPDHTTARQYHESALSLAATLEGPSDAERQALQGISELLGTMGDNEGGRFFAKRARQCADSLGDIYGASLAIAQEADCCCSLGDFREAARLCAESRELLRACGLEGGMIDLKAQIFQAEIHMLKTEYLDARAANTRILSTPHRSAFQAALARINLALIDVALGGQPNAIRLHVDIASSELTELRFPLGTYLCNIVYADLHLGAGNASEAESLFTTAFQALRDQVDEGAIICLERLADLGNGMHGVNQTLQWTGVFLASAHKTKNRLAMMKAIRCLGHILAAHGDEETALQLFEVALEGFTLMGVHGWAADCMLLISGILEKQERLEPAIDLLQKARPLFERSAQFKQVELIDSRVEMLRTAKRK